MTRRGLFELFGALFAIKPLTSLVPKAVPSEFSWDSVELPMSMTEIETRYTTPAYESLMKAMDLRVAEFYARKPRMMEIMREAKLNPSRLPL